MVPVASDHGYPVRDSGPLEAERLQRVIADNRIGREEKPDRRPKSDIDFHAYPIDFRQTPLRIANRRRFRRFPVKARAPSRFIVSDL